MPIRTLLKRNTYYDSITLMSLARALKDLPGVEDAGAVMATVLNCELLSNSRLLPLPLAGEQQEPLNAEDLLIVVRASDETRAEAALIAAQQLLARRLDHSHSHDQTSPTIKTRSLEIALRHENQLDEHDQTASGIAVISVAGPHAWLEAEQALHHGLHVFLFSDNVPLEQEQRLKTLAISKDLLFMGPDCGTAMINGIGLGFCNVVPRGSIGIAGASGTGMQQIMCLISAAGLGISQAVGTGGRDLTEAIGGVMMKRALSLLAADPQTEVIVLVSKPPDLPVARDILAHAQLDKPVVAVFVGADLSQFADSAGHVHLARTLTKGAELAVEQAGGDRTRIPNARAVEHDRARLIDERQTLAPTQRYLRALYSGGTLCDEAMLLLSESVGPIASNIPLQPAWALAAGEAFRGHTALDLGADEFTRGRPHPMIDPTICLHYLAQAAADPETAVVLLDIVLGFCAHANPAAIFAPAISQARANAAEAGRSLPIIITLCGTEGDPQQLSLQRTTLEAAGALVYESNVAAAHAAAYILAKEDHDDQ